MLLCLRADLVVENAEETWSFNIGARSYLYAMDEEFRKAIVSTSATVPPLLVPAAKTT